MKLNLPNKLTMLRCLLVPVFLALITIPKNLYVACIGGAAVFAAASITDMLDGKIARSRGLITDFGKFMDPLADKLMLIAVLACFWFKGVIPLYIMLIILAKDAIMIIVGGILYSKHVVVYADWFGKIATGLFVGAITLTFMQLEFGICPFYLYAYFAAIAAALISFFHYGINTFIRNRKKK